jgi:CheY-like chemotaxis protein
MPVGVRALLAARARLRRGQAAADGVEGAAYRAIGVLVVVALVGVVSDDDVVAGQRQLDTHAVMVAVAMVVMRRVDEHPQRLDAIADPLEVRGARVDESDQCVRRFEAMKRDLDGLHGRSFEDTVARSNLQTTPAPVRRSQRAQSLRRPAAGAAIAARFVAYAPAAVGPRFARCLGMRPATRILIVDDEPNARNALSELLRDEGYEVESAVGGTAARARLAEFHPDVLLTDVHMPGVDGLGLVAIARGMPDGGPAVVLMSARPQPHGVDEPFIGKPIDIEKLLATVETALHRR